MVWMWPFKKKSKTPRFGDPAYYYEMGGGWSDKIEWWNGTDRVVGWKARRPQKGDVLMAEMASGKMDRVSISHTVCQVIQI
jgi:hypothetical protein